MAPKQKPHRSVQDVCTPPDFIEALERRFGSIEFDLACTSDNAVGGRGFMLDHGIDAFQQDWGNESPCFCNPPFGAIGLWAKRIAEETEKDPQWRCFFLVPASVGSTWYRKYVHGKAYVLALEPRLKFVGHDHCFPKDLILAVYGHGLHGFDVWNWKGKP